MPIATKRDSILGKATGSYGATAFALKSNLAVSSIKDLRGKRIGVGQILASAGFQLPWKVSGIGEYFFFAEQCKQVIHLYSTPMVSLQLLSDNNIDMFSDAEQVSFVISLYFNIRFSSELFAGSVLSERLHANCDGSSEWRNRCRICPKRVSRGDDGGHDGRVQVSGRGERVLSRRAVPVPPEHRPRPALRTGRGPRRAVDASATGPGRADAAESHQPGRRRRRHLDFHRAGVVPRPEAERARFGRDVPEGKGLRVHGSVRGRLRARPVQGGLRVGPSGRRGGRLPGPWPPLPGQSLLPMQALRREQPSQHTVRRVMPPIALVCDPRCGPDFEAFRAFQGRRACRRRLERDVGGVRKADGGKTRRARTASLGGPHRLVCGSAGRSLWVWRPRTWFGIRRGGIRPTSCTGKMR